MSSKCVHKILRVGTPTSPLRTLGMDLRLIQYIYVLYCKYFTQNSFPEGHLGMTLYYYYYII